MVIYYDKSMVNVPDGVPRHLEVKHAHLEAVQDVSSIICLKMAQMCCFLYNVRQADI